MSNSPISSLHVQQFRSYESFAVELVPSVNIVVGPNAGGKTNLLEAVLLASGLGSYRATWEDVVKHGHEWSRVDMRVGEQQRTLKLQYIHQKLHKSFLLNEKEKKRLAFDDVLPVVLFEPEHMRLLTGSPSLRRDFLDDVLEVLVPGFRTVRRQYIRTLAQRNQLLKQTTASMSGHLFAWNIRLAELAGTIVANRLRLLQSFNDLLGDIYTDIAGSKTDITLHYESPLNIDLYESSLLQSLDTHVQTDIQRGFTGFGPHREDISVLLRNVPAGSSASRGETRTIVLGLKLAELRLLEKNRDQSPIVLLDDVFSELDGMRRGALTSHLQTYQTIITTTDADIVSKNFAQTTNIIALG